MGYRDFLFQYTITALDTHWEPGLPPLEERLTAFEQLAQRWGPARVDWRFDPHPPGQPAHPPPGTPGGLKPSAAGWPPAPPGAS